VTYVVAFLLIFLIFKIQISNTSLRYNYYCVPATQILSYLLTCTPATYGWQTVGFHIHLPSVGVCCSPNDSFVQTY